MNQKCQYAAKHNSSFTVTRQHSKTVSNIFYTKILDLQNFKSESKERYRIFIMFHSPKLLYCQKKNNGR